MTLCTASSRTRLFHSAQHAVHRMRTGTRGHLTYLIEVGGILIHVILLLSNISNVQHIKYAICHDYICCYLKYLKTLRGKKYVTSNISSIEYMSNISRLSNVKYGCSKNKRKDGRVCIYMYIYIYVYKCIHAYIDTYIDMHI